MKKKIDTEVNETTNSTNPDAVIVVQTITPLELDLGREDLNKVVEKLNEVIKKGNQ